ncbi:MAG TPA: hypothetical protein VFD21_14960 [Vicinamibacterales bacterium]|jgi:hypothetical protein|nr:hypothetical protein [Vicinamibacterales bacterium]
MEMVTRLRSTDVPNDALGPLLSDYLALDRLRSFRRLLLVRCGSLALATAVLGPLVGWLSAVARSVMVAVFLVPPAWAWILERRADTRLSERLQSIKTDSAAPAVLHQAE